MNYDMNSIKYSKWASSIVQLIPMICFTLFGLTACADTTDSKDNNDDNALIQGTWERDTGSGAGYKFVDDKLCETLKTPSTMLTITTGTETSEYYNGAEAMDIAGLQ